MILSDVITYINAFGAKYTGLLTLLGLVVAVIAIWISLIQKRGHDQMTLLLDHRTWPDLLASLNPSPAQAYQTAITRTNDWFTRLYGPNLLGWRALNRALSIAFAYSIATLLIGWLAFDAGRLGGGAFLPEGLPFVQRLSAVTVFALTGLILVKVLKLEGRITQRIKTFVAVKRAELLQASGPMRQARRWIWSAIGNIPAPFILIDIFIAIVFCAQAAILAGANAGAIAVALIIVIAGSTTVAGIAGIAIVIFEVSLVIGVIAIAVFGSLATGIDISVIFTRAYDDLLKVSFHFLETILLFLVLLPALNAIADFLSIAATRHFLRKIGALRAQVWSVVFGIAIDLSIAMLCLAGLLWSITAALDLWAHFATLPFDWRAYRAEICAGDWARGTMIWLMLITTLLPTALHLAAGLTAVLLRNRQIDREINAILRPSHDALIAAHGVSVFQTHQPDLAEQALTRSQQSGLDILLAKRGKGATLTFAVIFVVSMLGLTALAALTATFIYPNACPA